MVNIVGTTIITALKNNKKCDDNNLIL